MPFLIARQNIRLNAALIFVGFCLFAFQASWSAPIDKTLIESATLLHHEELTDTNPSSRTKRFRRAAIPGSAVEDSVSQAIPLNEISQTDFTTTMKGLFAGQGDNNNSEINDGLQVALDYIFNQKESFGLDAQQIGMAADSLVEAALSASSDPVDLAKTIPSTVIETFIPNASRQWGEQAPDLTKSLTEGIAKGSRFANIPIADRDSVTNAIVEGAIASVLKQIRHSIPEQRDLGFMPGIDPVDPNRKKSEGAFHPDKTRVLEYAANGLTYGTLISARDNRYPAEDIAGLAESIGSGAAKSGIEFMAQLQEDAPGTDGKDYSLFTYEIIKSISSGVSLGSILVTGSNRAWASEKIPEKVAERVAFGVASSALETNFEKQFIPSIDRLGEAAAFGSSMGAQFATVFDPKEDNFAAWDWELHGKEGSYDRIALAEASSKGAAEGAISKAAEKYAEDQVVGNELATASREEILELARGTAMGSVLSNVAMAIYYDNELQDVITASSKGSSFGSLTANNLTKIETRPGGTEEFEVEMARAVANGATTGTLFEVVGLLDANPEDRLADMDSVLAAKSASYGSTLGAILGGDVTGQDSISLKQAVEQGATEGSLDGVALAMGFDEIDVPSANIQSEVAIKNAVELGNTQAAEKAAGELTIKSIQPQPADMLLLMQKYNINPGTTNPGFVFPNPTKKGEEDFLFDGKFPVASPI